jgi:hypothetical protein
MGRNVMDKKERGLANYGHKIMIIDNFDDIPNKWINQMVS